MRQKVLLVGILALVVLSGAGLGWLWSQDQPVETSVSKRFRIPAGEPLGVTAQRLWEAGLIRNPLVFRMLFQVWQGDGTFPSGTFQVPAGMSSQETAVFFTQAQPLQVKITVPEGWTATKIAALLEEKQISQAQEFLEVARNPSRLGALGAGLATLEGRLFPDTYLFPLETPAAEVAKSFLLNFQNKTQVWKQSLGEEEFNQKVILASIVEREYRRPEEAPLIASVFSNRLEMGIALGSCATIEYILTEIQGRPHPKRIFFVHTEIASPFNTYLNKGLPPAPISNPGLTALRAVMEPKETNFLYFVVADPTKGTHTFSSLYSQHEKARAAYLSSYVTKD